MFDLKPYEHKNQVSSYNPFRDIDAFERNFFSNPFGFFGSNMLAEFKTDITDNGNEYLLEADLPGFKKEDIKLDISGDVLTVQAERHSEHEDKDKKNKYVRCERSYGLYSRQFDVSEIDTENIKAKYENGVLKLTLPKKSEVSSSPKRVEIE